MKCPKCGYIGFEDVDRCRNCGCEFSLAAPHRTELTIRDGDVPAEAPHVDLSLLDSALASSSRGFDDRESGLRPPTRELPLFGEPRHDDQPLITKPSPPRPPLSVRRSTPEVPKLRTPVRASTMSVLDAEQDDTGGSWPRTGRAATESWPDESDRAEGVDLETAALASRLVATAIDLIILAGIDVVIVYFTMQICGLSIEEASMLPKGPLVTFLVVQNGGYLVAFTAGGQTLGKMAAGIKVVPSDSKGPLDLGHSIVRTIIWAALAVPAGLGFLSALVSHDRRGLHDRCAGTRVVRASA